MRPEPTPACKSIWRPRQVDGLRRWGASSELSPRVAPARDFGGRQGVNSLTNPLLGWLAQPNPEDKPRSGGLSPKDDRTACGEAPKKGVGQGAQLLDGPLGECRLQGRPARRKRQRGEAQPDSSDSGGVPPAIGLGPNDGAPGPPSLGAL